MDQASSRPKGRQKRNAAVQQAATKDKCTLLLDPETSLKLTIAAHLRGLDRSELVNELLTEALRCVVVSLRGQLPGANTDRLKDEDAVNTAA